MHKSSQLAARPSAHFLGSRHWSTCIDLSYDLNLIKAALFMDHTFLSVDSWSYPKPCSRLCLGAYRTAPASSLCIEANEPPLYFRRKKLSLQYCLKLSCNYNSLAYAADLSSKFTSVFERKPTQLLHLQSIHVGRFANGWFQKEWCYCIFYTN